MFLEDVGLEGRQLAQEGSAQKHSSPNFIRLAYTKTRSMTGSTEASSICSTNGESCPDDELVDVDTFFDCQSQASFETVNHDDEIVIYDHVRAMCCYSDGTPAFAPPGHCVSKVSEEFLDFHDYDEAKAQQMWEAMLQWREATGIWKIHRRPNVRFECAKKYYPSCYHGVDKGDCILEYSFPGRMVPKKLLPDMKALEEIMDHHKFMQEYLFNCLYTHEESWREIGKEPIQQVPGESTTRGIVLVIDVKDTGVNVLSGNAFTFMKRMIYNSTSYYPEMAKQVLLLNAPFWVAGVFKTIKPLLPDGLPVEIVSAKQTFDALRVYVDEDQIPVEYGGRSEFPLHQHPFELRLHEKAREAANYGQKANEARCDTSEPGLQESVDGAGSVGSTILTTSSGHSSGAASFDDNTATQVPSSLCGSLPFSNSLPRSQEPTFVMDANCDDDLLTLTPSPPRFDLFAMTSSILKGVSFEVCGGQ